MINSRFAVAVHLLALMSYGKERFPDQPVTSELLAQSVNTNPVVIRRILGCLRKGRIVSSQPGRNGGWFLERGAAEIRLSDVFKYVTDDDLFCMHNNPPNAHCMFGAHIQSALLPVFKEAEAAMEDKLAQHSIADVANKVMAHAG